MRRLSLCLILAACTVPDPAANVPRGKPFLWEASGRGTIHLFGTYWRECPEEFPHEAVQQLAAGKTFVTLTHGGAGRGFFYLPSPRSLLDYMSFDQVKELEYRYGSGVQMHMTDHAAESFRYIRPSIFVQVIAHVRACKRSVDFDPFVESAKRQGATVVSLEEPELLTLMIDDAADAKTLSLAMSDSTWARREYVRTITAYRAGDETAFTQPESSLDAALRSRHSTWAARLLALAEKGLVAVELPVGDLVGPDGLIAELEKLGYEVRRI